MKRRGTTIVALILVLCVARASAQELPTLPPPAPAEGVIVSSASAASEAQQKPEAPSAQDAEAAKLQATLKQLGEGVQQLSKNLTVLTGKEEWKIILFGELKGEVLYSSSRPVIPGAPLLLAPASPFGLSDDTIDVHGKPTLLGALVVGPEVCDFKAGGLILAALYSETVVQDRYGLLPLQAFGELKNDTCRFAAGLQLDVFNPLIPNMVNFNTLWASGNSGGYRGQVRGEHFLYPDADSQITIQAALGEPLPTVITDGRRISDIQLSEDNGWPNVEGRVALAFGPIEGEGPEARRPFEVGVSGLVGEIRTTPFNGQRVVADAWGVGADARWKVHEWFGFQAEVFHGQTLGTYLAGSLQTVNSVTLEGIRASGGWAEVYFYLTPCVHLHLGYGIDDPLDRDLAFAQIVRNETCFGTLFWDVTEAFRIGVELSYRETTYRGLLDNDGVLLHTQFRWKF